MKALAAWLKTTNTSQKTLADLVGVTQPTISDILGGKYSPSVGLLKKLIKVTGLSADELLAEEAA